MADEGHEATEALIGEVSERVRREYVAAYEEAEEKLADYLRRFEAKDRIHAEAVRRGEETEADYREWRRGQILVGRRWQELVDALAEDYRNADRIAASITSGYLPDAYAINHDYATFQVERGSNLDTSYTLYDRATVERLIRDQPDLLPAVKVDGRKDLAWNRRHLASAITQGVLQGESMDRVARRIRSVADMDYRAAMRTARTAMTSAQNAGRVDAYRRAQGMGIRVRKQWLATLDGRTRHSHRRLDGEVVGLDEEFSNGLSYPGDPSGAGSEVYNCRCTLVADLPDVDYSEGTRSSKLGGVSYEQWRGERERALREASMRAPGEDDRPWTDGEKGYLSAQMVYGEGSLAEAFDDWDYNWWSYLDERTQGDFRKYQDSAVAVNGQLRSGAVKPNRAAQIRRMTEALDEAAVEVPFVCQRISTGDLIGFQVQPTVEQIRALAGKEVKDPGFVSASPTNRENYKFFGLGGTGVGDPRGVVHYHIRVPVSDGAGGLLNQGVRGNNEFLFNRGGRFRVLGAYEDDRGMVNCNLEWVGRDEDELVVERRKRGR